MGHGRCPCWPRVALCGARPNNRAFELHALELVLKAASPTAPTPGEAPWGVLSWDMLQPDSSPAMDVA